MPANGKVRIFFPPQPWQEAGDALRHFSAPVSEDLLRVAKRIRDILEELGRTEIVSGESEQLLRAPVLHLFMRDGKLLRPMLVLLSARGTAQAESDGETLVRAAAAVEILHTASLAHDDIVDASESRRGSPSLHAAYGNATAVLVGDLF
jgi:geranylgeranyl pyrophosphate synthase